MKRAVAISYRREDTQEIVGRIYDRLVQDFGRENVSRDFDSFKVGKDFRQIREAIRSCDVLLAVIGLTWASAGDQNGPKIMTETDFVRFELETAKSLNKRIIPVLIGVTEMPVENQGPSSISDIRFNHALRVDTGIDFDHHMARLIRSITD